MTFALQETALGERAGHSAGLLAQLTDCPCRSIQQRAGLVLYTVPSFFSHDPDMGINRKELGLVHTPLLLEKRQDGHRIWSTGLHDMPSQAT